MNPRLAYPSATRKPPHNVLQLTSKLPAFAFVIVWADGEVENPEFVADYWEGDDGFIGELYRWRNHNLLRIEGERGFECWMKCGKSFGPGEWTMVNPGCPGGIKRP